MAALLALAVSGLVLRLVGRRETPGPYALLQHWTENLLLVQVVLGVVLLVAGRRVLGELAFLHYFYGSLFPFIAVVGGRIAALRRETRAYVGMAWGAFFATGLATRAMITGLESSGRSLFDLF
jgi:hypothetical protein